MVGLTVRSCVLMVVGIGSKLGLDISQIAADESPGTNALAVYFLSAARRDARLDDRWDRSKPIRRNRHKSTDSSLRQ
jgi:hypothetical protein